MEKKEKTHREFIQLTWLFSIIYYFLPVPFETWKHIANSCTDIWEKEKTIVCHLQVLFFRSFTWGTYDITLYWHYIIVYLFLFFPIVPPYCSVYWMYMGKIIIIVDCSLLRVSYTYMYICRAQMKNILLFILCPNDNNCLKKYSFPWFDDL